MTGRLLVIALGITTAADCGSQRPWGRASLLAGAPARTIEIDVSEHGFSTAKVPVRVGETVEIVFKRTTERTCAKRVVVSLDANQRVERDLPVDAPVALTLHFDRPGELGFSCSMGMYGGVIDVEP